MKISHVLVAALAAATGACAATGGAAVPAWVSSRTSDPITSVERCTVSSPDSFRGAHYTRVGFLYPFVERHSSAGLLVGVTTGGAFRTTPGDIVWRVDQSPHRTLSAAQTPVIGDMPSHADTSSMDDATRAIFEQSQAMTAGFTSSLTHGITAVGGAQAEEMLAEMRAGTTLLYRAVAASPGAGMPAAATHRVGQYRDGELQPIPLDDSFHAALADCGL